MRRISVLVGCCLIASAISQQWDKQFWKDVNAKELQAAMKKTNTNVAKNLVLAIGDGMGTTTTTAIRVYKGQKEGMLGEDAVLSWDKFPHTGNSKTYCTDMMTTDSAASATAYHCGVKTKYEAVGVDDTVQRKNCSTVEGASVKSVLDFALEAGKSVGIISTDRITGASPAGAYAHSAFRDWQSDKDLPDEAIGVCKDIAEQLVTDNLDIQVILGGGRDRFFPKETIDPEEGKGGKRKDKRDLTAEWITGQTVIKQRPGSRVKYVTNQNQFDMVTATNTDYLLGLFSAGRMQEETERVINKTEPSLTEMVEKAISILSKNPKGFYLFIEGANIDKGHHANRARYALEEGVQFDSAVSKVMELTSTDDTLVVVSADHSHAFAFGGYSRRGQSILSISNQSYYPTTDLSGNHYTVLSYGNGPGYVNASARPNLTDEYYQTDRVYQSAFPLSSETHGGEDVQIFASGPMSHLFTGTHEQTFIAHGMAYAACIGENKDHCTNQKIDDPSSSNHNTAKTLVLSMMLAMVHIFV